MSIGLYVLARLFAIESDLKMPSAPCRRVLLLGGGRNPQGKIPKLFF